MAVLFDEDDAGPFKRALDYLKVARPPASGPLPADLKHEEYVAAKILNENATGRDEGGKDAARDLLDRTRTTKEVNLIRLLPVWFWRSPHNPYARDKGRAEAGPPNGAFVTPRSTSTSWRAPMRDIVGLYLDPPDRAVVLGVDEKSHGVPPTGYLKMTG